MARKSINTIIAEILKCERASIDSDGVAHYILNPKDIWNINLTPIEHWNKHTLHGNLVIDIWEAEKKISLSYQRKNFECFFLFTAFLVDSIFVYEERDIEPGEYRIAFRSCEFGERYLVVELEPVLEICYGDFFPLKDTPNKVNTKYRRT